jgi:hypothetical protein
LCMIVLNGGFTIDCTESEIWVGNPDYIVVRGNLIIPHTSINYISTPYYERFYSATAT